MSTLCYLRSSLQKQELSPQVQQELIEKYCLANSLSFPVMYQDKATSGGKFIEEREAGSKLMRDLRKGDHVVMAKADRMFRSLKDCVNICENFRRLEVSLHIVNFHGMSINLATPIGRALMHMMACFAELERDTIKERTSDTVRHLRSNGLAHARPSYGFKHVPGPNKRADGTRQNIVVPDPEEREVMAMLADWRRQKWSYQQMHEKLNYNLKIRTREGKEWNLNRIRSAIKAELLLQLRELGTCVADSH